MADETQDPRAAAPGAADVPNTAAAATAGEVTTPAVAAANAVTPPPVPRSPRAPKGAATKKDGTPAAGSPDAPKPAENLSLDPNEVEKPKIVRAKGAKNIVIGIAHIYSTFNNTSVTITDLNGNVIGWSSAGKVGFKGSRKSTAYAAQMAAQDASRQAMGHGLKEVEVRVKGPGAGRESAVRALQAIGLEVTVIKDVTPVPHNGCRPPKQRRV